VRHGEGFGEVLAVVVAVSGPAIMVLARGMLIGLSDDYGATKIV